jgi:hypothetical protein
MRIFHNTRDGFPECRLCSHDMMLLYIAKNFGLKDYTANMVLVRSRIVMFVGELRKTSLQGHEALIAQLGGIRTIS